MRISYLPTLALGVVLAASGQAVAPKRYDIEALLLASREVQVGIPASGVLAEVHVELGQSVTQGMLLAELESDVEQASAALQRARAASQAELASSQERLANLQRQWDSQSRLNEQGIVSDEILDELSSEVRLAEIDVLRAQEAGEQAELSSQLAEAELERRRIRAPLDGWVVERLLDPGELAGPGANEVLVHLMQLDPLIVDVPCPMPLRENVEVGQEIALRPGHPGQTWRKATIKAISPHIDPASETFQVRLELPNPEAELPSGLGCVVRFEL